MASHPERDGRDCGGCGMHYRQGADSLGPDCPLCAARRRVEHLEATVGRLQATIDELAADDERDGGDGA